MVGSGFCAGYPGGGSTVSSAESPRSVESPESVTGGGDPDVGVTGGQAFDRRWDGVREPRSILVAHETKFQSRALKAWAYCRSTNSTSFGPANQWKTPALRALTADCAMKAWPCIITSLAEGQTKNEAWRLNKKEHRPHGALEHLTPNEFVAQPQASRVAEKVACSSSGLSRDGTNVRISPQRRLNHNKTDNGATARTATAAIAIRTLLRASRPPRTSIVRCCNEVTVKLSAHLSPSQNNNGIVNP